MLIRVVAEVWLEVGKEVENDSGIRNVLFVRNSVLAIVRFLVRA